MFNNIKYGTANLDSVEVNLNPKRKFLYVDDANFITPSTTAGISQAGYNDDIEIKNDTYDPSIALYSSTGLNPKIDFIRYGRTFGADNTNDWRISNIGSTYLTFQNGKNGVISDKVSIGDNNLELNTLDLYVSTGYKSQSEKYTGLSFSSDFSLGSSGDSGIINSYRDLTINTGKKITTPNIIISGLTANKLVLTDSNKNLISSSYTDLDFARLSALNSFTGNNNTFNHISINSGYTLTTPSIRSINTTSNLSIGDIQTTGGIIIGNSTPANDTGTLTINKNTTLDATKILKTTKITGNTTSSDITLGQSGDTGLIYSDRTIAIRNNNSLNINSSTGQVYTGNLNSWDGISEINVKQGLVLETGKNLTLSSTGTLKTDKITGTATSSNIINIGDTTDTTSSISLNRDTTLNTNKTLTIQGTGYISTPLTKSSAYTALTPTGNYTLGENGDTGYITGYRDILLSSNKTLKANKIDTNFSTFAVDLFNSTTSGTVNLLSSHTNNLNIHSGASGASATINLGNSVSDSGNLNIYKATTYLKNLVVNNGIDCLGTITDSLGDLQIGETTDTTKINLYRDVNLGTTLNNKKLSTNLIGALSASNSIYLGDAGDTGLIYSNRDIETISKGFYTSRIASNKMTLPNTNTLNIGFNDPTNYTGIISLNQNVEVPTGRNLKVNDVKGTTANSTINLYNDIALGNIFIGNSSNNNPRIYAYNDLWLGDTTTNRTLYANTLRTLQNTNSASIHDFTTTGNITLGTGLTSGTITIGNASSTGSYQTSLNGKVRFLCAIDGCYINTNSGNNIFTSASLAGKYISNTLWANAPNERFTCWDTTAENASGSDASAICMNGNTMVFITPFDQNIYYLDEDSMTTANNYAWTGFRVSSTGAIVASSDRRIKRDIEPIIKDDLLNTLSKIEIVNYKLKAPTDEKYYKNGELRKKYQEKHIGVIAQDLIKAGLKEVVVRENEESYWTVNYNELNMYFNLGVQELIKENKNKDERIKILEEKVLELENKTNISTVDKVLALEQENLILQDKILKITELLNFKFGTNI